KPRRSVCAPGRMALPWYHSRLDRVTFSPPTQEPAMFRTLFGSQWTRRLVARKSPVVARRRGAAPRGKTLFRPRLEPLEDRLAPAMHVWSGAVSELWSDSRNWSSGGTPNGEHAADIIFPATDVALFTSNNDTMIGTTFDLIEFDQGGYDIK